MSLPQHFLTSQRGRLPLPRGLCNPSDLLLWAKGSLHISPTGAENLKPVNVPVSLSINSLGEIPPDSLQTHSLVKRTVHSQLRVCLDNHLQGHIRHQRVPRFETCHLVKEALF